MKTHGFSARLRREAALAAVVALSAFASGMLRLDQGSLVTTAWAHVGEEPDSASAKKPRASDAAQQRAADIAEKTMSPFCKGMTLASCSSDNARAWRDDIRRWADEGLSDDEIRQRLQQRTPDFDLSGAPRGALAWRLPLGLAGVGLVLLAVVMHRVLRKRPRDSDEREEPSSAAESGLDERLDRELEEMDDEEPLR